MGLRKNNMDISLVLSVSRLSQDFGHLDVVRRKLSGHEIRFELVNRVSEPNVLAGQQHRDGLQLLALVRVDAEVREESLERSRCPGDRYWQSCPARRKTGEQVNELFLPL